MSYSDDPSPLLMMITCQNRWAILDPEAFDEGEPVQLVDIVDFSGCSAHGVGPGLLTGRDAPLAIRRMEAAGVPFKIVEDLGTEE